MRFSSLIPLTNELAKSPITVIYYSVVQLIACDNLLLGAGDEYGPCRFHESDARHQA